jgi:undecaprenyl pyrophosphate phosphatase UppP
MKEKLKKELPFSLGNFLWRITVPMACLLIIGFLLDKFAHTKHLFEYMAVLTSLIITVWSIRVSLREERLTRVKAEE